MIRTVVFLSLAVAGCAEKVDVDVDCSQFEGRYMELRAGARWTYRITDGNKTSEKTQEVHDVEAVPGKPGVEAHRLVTSKSNGGMTTSWQEDTGTSVIRHREHDESGDEHSQELYEPHRTRIDESADLVVDGATWSESYTEHITDQDGVLTIAPKEETWTVIATDEVVQTPAGDFCALRLQRESAVSGNPGSTKTFWFVRGIGKIKEVGKDRVEELVELEP